jgi:hypothetical protein
VADDFTFAHFGKTIECITTEIRWEIVTEVTCWQVIFRQGVSCPSR